MNLNDFTHESTISGIVRLTDRAAQCETDLHAQLWHHIESDTRDVYRAIHRAAVKIFERHDDGFGDKTPMGLYADLEGSEVRLHVVSIDGEVVCEATLAMEY